MPLSADNEWMTNNRDNSNGVAAELPNDSADFPGHELLEIDTTYMKRIDKTERFVH